jgi:hypothetical protein
MLSPPQVAIILQVDEDWLRKQRQKQSNPTSPDDEIPIPHTKLGEAKNASVRYRLGDIRAHLANRRVINTHGGRVCAFSSFGNFMAHARIEDAWLFARLPSKRPIDFFEALRGQVNFEEAEWLTLGEYFEESKNAVIREGGKSVEKETQSGSKSFPPKTL